MELIQQIAPLLATLSCSLFAGAALYINLVEHPARMQCGTEIAATEFVPSYRRAAVMQAPLALISFVCSIGFWLAGGDGSWLLGGILIGAVVPFTLVVIMPVNKMLLDPALDRRAPRTRELLLRWGKLHAVRTALGAIALVVFLWLLASR